VLLVCFIIRTLVRVLARTIHLQPSSGTLAHKDIVIVDIYRDVGVFVFINFIQFKYLSIERDICWRLSSNISCLAGGQYSSVGIPTELRGGRSGIESWWGRDFPPVQTGPGAHPASCRMGFGSFSGVKYSRARAADHSPPSSAAVMEE